LWKVMNGKSSNLLASSKGASEAVRTIFIIFLGVIVLIILIAVTNSGKMNYLTGFNQTMNQASQFWQTSSNKLFVLGESYPEVVWSMANQWWVCVAPRTYIGNFWPSGNNKLKCGLARVPNYGESVCGSQQLGIKEKIDRDHPITATNDKGELTMKDKFASYWQDEEDSWRDLAKKYDICLSIVLAVVSHPSFEESFKTRGSDPANKHVRNLIGNLSQHYEDCPGRNSGKKQHICALDKLDKQFKLTESHKAR